MRDLKDNLLTMADLPTAPADPMPAVHQRIVRKRRLRVAAGTVAVVAGATVVATAVVPAIATMGGTSITPMTPVSPSVQPWTPSEQGATSAPTAPTSNGTAQPTPAGGDEPPKSAGKSTTARVSGPGQEEYVAGKQGPGYAWYDGADGGWGVTHLLNGTGAPCVTFEPTLGNARTCLDGFEPGERIRWTAKPAPGGGQLIAGFAKLDVGGVSVRSTSGEEIVALSTVATPTSDDVAFFELVLNASAPKVGSVVATNAK